MGIEFIISLIIPLLLGILAGIFTGLAPGIHINLIASTLLIYLSLIEKIFSINSIIVFIVSMSITHTFLDFLPSIFLGAPEEDTFMSILPGHKLLLEGEGYSAFIYSLYGSLTSLILLAPISILFFFFLKDFYNLIHPSIVFILIFFSTYLLLREKEKINAIIIFILSGFLGYFSFNIELNQPLFPLLTGLFGISGMILSLNSNLKIPEQKIKPLKEIKISIKEAISSALTCLLVTPLFSFLPGTGSGQAAFISSEIKEQNTKQFLFLVGIINTLIMSLSFIALYLINKSRTGTAAIIQQINPNISSSQIILIFSTIIITSIISFCISIFIAKYFVKIINRINYNKFSKIIIVLLILATFLISKTNGLIVLITATSLGIFCIKSNIKRINLMGALIIPTIIYYI
jgi:putative membrane protein